MNEDLDEKVNKSNSADVDFLKSELMSLKLEVESIAHILPKYRQLSYSERINTMVNTVESMNMPQRRFRVNRDRVRAHRGTTSAPPRTGTSLVPKGTAKEQSKERSNEIIRITEHSTTLNNVTDSIIVTNEIGSITMSNISSSIMVINSSGPAFLFNLTNCLVFVTCHQLRIHDSTSTRFVTNIPSKVTIIENSRTLKFDAEVEIKDFNVPFGKSPNYVKLPNSDKLIQLKQQILQDPNVENLQVHLGEFI